MVLDKHIPDGHSEPLIVQYAHLKTPVDETGGRMLGSPRSQYHCVYISNLPQDSSETTLYKLFSPCGTLHDELL